MTLIDEQSKFFQIKVVKSGDRSKILPNKNQLIEKSVDQKEILFRHHLVHKYQTIAL